MIEASRRHGHFDPRWHTNGLSPPRVLAPAAEADASSIQSWENEGGRYSMNDETDAPPGSSGTRSPAATTPGAAATTWRP